MMKHNIAIDIGSQYLTGALYRDGSIFSMPSVVAVDSNTGDIIEVGSGALAVAGANVTLVSPIKCGAISSNNVVCATSLFKSLLFHVVGNSNRAFGKMSVLCAVPCTMISTDKRIIEEILLSLGVHEVTFVESVIASSKELFAQFNISSGLVLDIGKDCSDIAVVTDEGIVKGCTLHYAGKALTSAIQSAVLKNTNIKISFDQAEAIKIKCASLYPSYNSEIKLSGVNINTNLVTTVTVNSKDLYNLTSNHMNVYCDLLNSLIYSSDASISASVTQNGILLCGGGAELIGLESYVQNKINLPVRLARKWREVVINGLLRMQ